jgi:hypothetical protein
LSFKPFSIFVFLSVMLMFSCAKEGSKEEANAKEDSNAQTELRDNFTDSPCYYNLIGVPCQNQATVRFFSRTIIVDGCPVEVKYWRRVCNGPGGGEIVSFYDFDIKIPNTKACSRLLPFQTNDPHVNINAGINALYKRISLIIENEYISANSTGSTITTIEFVEAGCSTHCIFTTFDESGDPMLNWTTVKCGTGCCKRTTEYVFSSPGVPVAQPPIIQGDPICFPVAWTCNGTHGTPLNICNPACAKL